MKPKETVNLDKIAEEGATATIGAISVAQDMGLFNDPQDLELLIRAGIREALDQLMLEIEGQN
jgi:hypothetical protein